MAASFRPWRNEPEGERALIITIDGPAAAGKSTVARALARRLGFDYLDTGAMYRAAAWKAMAERVDTSDPAGLARVAAEAKIEFVHDGDTQRVLCDGRDVTEQIRTPEVTANVRHVADHPAARAALIQQQRKFARGRNLVAEGRNQGTDVFPDADVKFYLEASLEARAARRLEDLEALGAAETMEEVRRQIACRDNADRSRPVGFLRQSDDMILIDSTNLSAEEVVLQMAAHVQRLRSETASGVKAALKDRS